LCFRYRNGAVVIIDVSKKSREIVQKLKGHDEEIHCVCWCPIQGEEISKEESKIDKNIFLLFQLS
jgi:gem associated protein 5